MRLVFLLGLLACSTDEESVWIESDFHEDFVQLRVLSDALDNHEGVDVAWAAAKPVVEFMDSSRGIELTAALEERIGRGSMHDQTDAANLLRYQVLSWQKDLIGDLAAEYPTPPSSEEDRIASIQTAHDLYATYWSAESVAAESLYGEAIDDEIEAGFLQGLEGIGITTGVEVGSAKQRVEKGLYRVAARHVAIHAADAQTANPVNPTATDMDAALRTQGWYDLIESRLYNANPLDARNSAGHYEIMSQLKGNPGDIISDDIEWELIVAFNKRTWHYTQHAAPFSELWGTPSATIKAAEGKSYYQLVAPYAEELLSSDTETLNLTWDAYIQAIDAQDEAGYAIPAESVQSHMCDLMIAMGTFATAEECSAVDSDGPYTQVNRNVTAWGWDFDDPATEVGDAWGTALQMFRDGWSTATTEDALDEAALDSAYIGHTVLIDLYDAHYPEGNDIVEAAFDAASIAIQRNDYAEAAAQKQIAEKTAYGLFARTIVARAQIALDETSAHNQALSFEAYNLISHRVYNADPSLSKNTPGHFRILDWLTGNVEDVLPEGIERDLDVAFAKRTLGYTRHGLPQFGGLIGTPSGYYKAVEGKAYFSVFADRAASGTENIGWDRWIWANGGGSLEVAEPVSSELQDVVCDFMRNDLGLPDCVTSDAVE